MSTVYYIIFNFLKSKTFQKEHCLVHFPSKKFVVFGSNYLKMSVLFDKNLSKSIILQYCLVVTLEVSILIDMKMRSIIL